MNENVNIENKDIYVRLRSLNPFRARFVYVDDAKGRTARQRLMGLNIGVKLESGWINESDLMIQSVTVPKKHEDKFVSFMEQHARNSLILGWGATDACRTTIYDMHMAAES